KNKIRQFFKKQRIDENIENGRELGENEVRGLESEMQEVLAPDSVKRVAEKFNFANEEDMFAAGGNSGITAAQIVTRLTDKFSKQREEEKIVEVK
ncbi:bifunctional (p)ppGpp synthetase/guanosine-3',5'-bis(diphosphate) 3'-pyrophosphohydrolase, partial [Bacillus cereus]|nr:bifunctional (p)ppGpp synthetase/guanosine-3',5'-bis(diphosphate) 3'-pyrophosphohydrolase [Bacillus cereus]